jgi:hypothetical protein
MEKPNRVKITSPTDSCIKCIISIRYLQDHGLVNSELDPSIGKRQTQDERIGSSFRVRRSATGYAQPPRHLNSCLPAVRFRCGC